MSVKSPCIGVCEMAVAGPAQGLCVGCHRTLEEIAGWSRASDGERLAILQAVDARRAAHAPAGLGECAGR